MNAFSEAPRTAFSTARDSHVCPRCNRRNPVMVNNCRGCGAQLVLEARGAVSFWVLGDVEPRLAWELARQVERALGCPVRVQPGLLDPRPSERPAWRGRSGAVILNQMERRQQAGCLTNVAIVADPVTSGSRDPVVYGYAYLGWGAACLSLQLVREDGPDQATLVQRTLSVCLHEIGHTLGLDDHQAASGIDCAMVGDVPAHRQFDPASYPTKLCGACLSQARERMAEFGAEIADNRFVPVVGAQFAGRYALLEPAGEGGYGAVWRARDLCMDQEVALKFVRSEGFDGHGEVRLVEEAAKARHLNHPNIVRVFDLARDAGVGGLVMDWIGGSNLEELRQERPSGVFDADDVREWAHQLCGAIQAAHDGGVTHQDIKPENCLIDDRRVLLLTDFGCARTSEGPRAVFLRGATLPVGTPGFSAPEQMNGAAPWPGGASPKVAKRAGLQLFLMAKREHAMANRDSGT